MENVTQKEKILRYSMDNVTKFRQSINRMGETVSNGTVGGIVLDNVIRGNSFFKNDVDVDTLLSTSFSDTASWRKFSRLFYQKTTYRKLIEYLSTIYYNQYIISPLFDDGKAPNGAGKKKLMRDYNNALRSLDEDMKVEEFTTQVLLNLLVEGQVFYYIEEYSKNGKDFFKAVQLPADYCKMIGTAGVPSINIYAVDLTFIDDQISKYVDKNIMTREEVINQYPKGIRTAYNNFRNGKLNNNAINNKWFIVPLKNSCAFSTSDGLPPLAYTLSLLARIKKMEPMRDDYISNNLTKLLLQLIDIDKDGNPEVDLELAAGFHQNLKGIASKKKNIDAMTTIAKDVKVLSLGETGDATKNYEYLKTYFDQLYTESGISSELFNSTTAASLSQSIDKDCMYMYKLREQISTWFNFYLGTICYGNITKSTKFVFSFLDISYKNREKMIESYIKGATYGFSKIAPQVALGVKQRYIESLNLFENDVLNLDKKLVPLQSSHTLSAAESDNPDSKNGRPKTSEDKKQDSTISKDGSL